MRTPWESGPSAGWEPLPHTCEYCRNLVDAVDHYGRMIGKCKAVVPHIIGGGVPLALDEVLVNLDREYGCEQWEEMEEARAEDLWGREIVDLYPQMWG